MNSRGIFLCGGLALCLLAGCAGVPEESPQEKARWSKSNARIKGSEIREWSERQKPTGEGNFHLGVMAYNKGDYETAVSEFRTAVRLNPKLTGAWGNLGAAQYRLDLLSEAEASLNKAIELDRNLADPYYNLALVYERQGNIRAALESCRRAVERKPKDFEVRRLFDRLKRNKNR